jgi:hypothetical protein
MIDIIKSILKWSVENYSNIMSGIVASVIVILLQVSVRSLSITLSMLFSVRWQLQHIWGLKKSERIYIVSGAITGVSDLVKTTILAGPDSEASSTLFATSNLLYPKSEIRHVYSSKFSRDLFKENIVSVGGPIHNYCTKDFLRKFSETVFFNDEMDLIFKSKCYSVKYDALDNSGTGDKPLNDYGIVVRTTNPYDSTKSILLIMGCDTYGVLAAARLVSSRLDSLACRKILNKKLGFKRYFTQQNYIAVVECDVLENDVGDIRLVDFVSMNSQNLKDSNEN